ncbi:arsenosugar biosynthesis radical SAM (seleno)protein ArsS [Trichlorobacter ammonificans]|uniref:Radical SAM/Cys-rich domain-containing protein n=1 Tax=Trichlorobacter ammonificans TaxID=2916410 RepID=A0ABM9DAT2_9BACT|nr:arsenosugar biosynthesis radical SAM (seleno)protein ArsS [Trichlorobacter ammonificans]CAH2031482.1 Radical SAM/Cys-rich domain-containing protein [Trichlorobacter ammonificans]
MSPDIERNALSMTFNQTLARHALSLVRATTDTLQVNIGRRCNLACRHCHLEAGPERNELMSAETVEQVIACAGRLAFTTIDITGGAPELLPHLPRLISGLRPHAARLMVRTNLTALGREETAHLIELYRSNRVMIVASLPSLNLSQTESQRGNGVWSASLATLQRLNSAGFGSEGSGLVLDIAVNPTGAFLPPSQRETELRFRRELRERHGISFTRLLTFANVPLGRFRHWLEQSGNLPGYLEKLRSNFNPGAVGGLMCRSVLSVDWQGYLYDCDFNQAARLYHRNGIHHISALNAQPLDGLPIPTGEHCFACTAGAGFTCGGSLDA